MESLAIVKPEEFFREKVTQAAANQQVDIDPNLEFYLVNLLCDFIAPSKIKTVMGDMGVLEMPMAIVLKKALEAPRTAQLRIFKFLGDSSLYFAGFFQDYFNRRTFDIDYYITLGSTAYSNVSSIMRDHHQDEHFKAVYDELAGRFADLVEVVAEVSDNPSKPQPEDILAIYDRWTRTNSDRLRRILEEMGIRPTQSSQQQQ